MKTINDKYSRIPNKDARLYFRSKDRGLCVRCHLPNDGKFANCSLCRKYSREYKKARYQPKIRKIPTK